MDGRFDDYDWEEAHRALVDLGLSEIEVRIARLVSGGHKNVRIAGDLGITLSRVKWTLRGLFIKFGVADREALGDVVGARLTALRKREGRRRPAQKRPPDLRILREPRRTKRKRPEHGEPGNTESRSAPPA